MTSGRILIVPAEVKARELYSRLYFSAKAARRGYTVLFGRSTDLHKNLRAFPKGTIVENDVTPKGYRFIAYARSLGYDVVAWDEEAIVTLSDEIYAEYRVAEKTLERVSLLFTRGPGDAAAIAAKHPSLAGKLRQTGNPRFDILRPNLFPHQAATSQGPSNIILFNSRFASVNPYFISPEQARRNRLAKFGLLGRDTRASRAINRWLDHEQAAFEHCRKLVADLARAFPEKTIVVRPHPSEGHGAWKEIARDYHNCEVRGDGSAIDWILQADVLVHNSCTTAIEANMLGVPTISFLPNYDEVCDNHLTNLMGPQCKDVSSVVDAVKATSPGGKAEIEARSDKARGKYASHFAGLGGTDASDLILDAIDECEAKAEPWRWRLGVLSNHWKIHLKHTVKELIVPARRPSADRLKARAGYQAQKFADTSERELADVLSRLGFAPLRIEPIAEQWFRLTADRPDARAATATPDRSSAERTASTVHQTAALRATTR